MKKIKYRVWMGNKMNYGDEDFNRYELEPNGTLNLNQNCPDGIFTDASERIMLCSNLKDSKGTEIYEGDLIQNGKYTYIVKFVDAAFYLFHVDIKDYDRTKLRWGLLNKISSLENPIIIGNDLTKTN